MTFLCVGVAIETISRLELWFVYGRPTESSFSHLALVLGVGALNDLLPLAFLAAALVGYVSVAPERLVRSKAHPLILKALLFASWFGLLFLAAVEHYFFEEFDSRFNLVAVDYLIYPHEVLINIRDSYPVGSVVFVAAVTAFLLVLVTRRQVRPDGKPGRRARRKEFVVSSAILVLIGVVSATVPVLLIPRNRIDRELGSNGIRSFLESFATNEIDYPRYYRTESSNVAYELIRDSVTRDGSRLSSRTMKDLTRSVGPANGLGRLNVVVVVEESFGCEYVEQCGGREGLSPRYDDLATRGIVFDNAYATGTRTVRGLEAITLSFPPIPSEAVVKRPGSEHLANWGQVMRENGYDTSFLYGGFGTFDNMNEFFSSNGFEISDRLSIDNPRFGNIWGVSDQDLFRHALGYFDERAMEDRPFFSIVLTTSNHKPFTFPEGIPGVPAEGGGREAGIRYADYALGEFIDQAARRPWFDRTLFVIVADHGARVYGRAEIPLPSYHIPLLLYSPAHLAPRSVDERISQMDIAPSILALLGLPWKAPFYGRNVFSGEGEPRIPVNHNHDVGLLVDDEMVILGLHKSVGMVKVDLETGDQQTISPDPDLVDLTTAYYQTAYDQFHNGRNRSR